jgi:hypothetical protein
MRAFAVPISIPADKAGITSPGMDILIDGVCVRPAHLIGRCSRCTYHSNAGRSKDPAVARDGTDVRITPSVGNTPPQVRGAIEVAFMTNMHAVAEGDRSGRLLRAHTGGAREWRQAELLHDFALKERASDDEEVLPPSTDKRAKRRAALSVKSP